MKTKVTFLAMVLALAAFGCIGVGLTPTVGGTPTPYVPATPVPSATLDVADRVGEAAVDSIEILILESFPVQVHVVARGNLPDGCTRIEQVLQERDGNTFRVTITTLRPGGLTCTEALVPFERVIPLDVHGLPAGVYTVIVNGVSGTFELTVDNVMPTESIPTEPAPTEPVQGAIGGKVWHDLCAVPYQTVPDPPEGCVALPGGGFEANGLLEPGEPGLEGVVVTLGAGACPSSGLLTTVTGADGLYLFPGLDAGTYCVSVDALDATNETILIPGGWTHPEGGSATIALTGGAEVLDVNFGWDYQFLP